MSIVIYTDRNITRKLALQRMNITGRGLADSGRKCGIGFNRPKSNSFTAKSEFDKFNRVQTVGVPFIRPDMAQGRYSQIVFLHVWEYRQAGLHKWHQSRTATKAANGEIVGVNLSIILSA